MEAQLTGVKGEIFTYAAVVILLTSMDVLGD
jgi:hypothetical protein